MVLNLAACQSKKKHANNIRNVAALGSAKAMEWLASHWTQPRNCPICDGQQWWVGQALEFREYNSGDIVIGGDSRIMPITAVVCQTCGYTFFMNAMVSGAVPSEPNQTEQGKGES